MKRSANGENVSASRFYPTSHLVNREKVLFLALIASDHRKAIFYADLLLVPDDGSGWPSSTTRESPMASGSGIHPFCAISIPKKS